MISQNRPALTLTLAPTFALPRVRLRDVVNVYLDVLTPK